MAISSVAKNFRDGQLAIEDGAGSPLTVTVQYEDGNFSASGFTEGLKDIAKYEDRGAFYSARHTKRVYPSGSFAAHLTDIADGTEKTLFDLANKTGAWAAATSTLGANAEVMTYKITWTVEGTDHGDTGDHTLVLDDCRLSCDISEGDPSTITISFECMGAVTAT